MRRGIIAVLGLVLAVASNAAGQEKHERGNATAKKIASARSAAPAEISAKASIAEVAADGKMTTLREGTNGWLCMPDNPMTPGPDPVCADKVAQEWFGAYMAKKPVAIRQIGIVYMLAGGTDASNTDPYATKPTAGNQWVKTPPHVMVVPPDPKMLDSYSTEPSAGMPFVMWKGTPYAHLMVPARKSR
jgi:hypothetical protein